MVQLVDEHPGSNFILLVFGEINERCKILNDVTARIANRTDEDPGPELAAILAAAENFRPAGRTFEALIRRQRLGIQRVLRDINCKKIWNKARECLSRFCWRWRLPKLNDCSWSSGRNGFAAKGYNQGEIAGQTFKAVSCRDLLLRKCSPP